MYDDISEKTGFSVEAVQHFAEALRRGGGTMAQFNHPEFSGSGQWMPGMVMVSDMMNNALKSRIMLLASELTANPQFQAAARPVSPANWWPAAYQNPTASGSQNDTRYAYFASENRLFIQRGGRLRAYDTIGHTITGVSHQQAAGKTTLTFSNPTGPLSESDLPRIFDEPAT